MKSTITLILLLSIVFNADAQLTNEQKIIDVYGLEWVNQMKTDNPVLLQLFDKYVSYGFMVKAVSTGKYSEFQPLEYIPLRSKSGGEVSVAEFLEDFNSDNFNPLKYAFFPTTDFQVFKLKDVDFIIYILPQQEIMKK